MNICVALCSNGRPCMNKAVFRGYCASHWWRDYKARKKLRLESELK